MRRLAYLIVLLASLVHATGAFAHASLVRAEPADGAMLADPPALLRLIFNEPVSPLVMRLIGPSGEVIAPAATAENTVVTVMPPRLRQGTHVLSWRVVSADGHPVGGSLIFSVGTATPPVAGPEPAGNPLVRGAVWAAKLVLYAGLFLGVGGVFFRTWFGVGNVSPSVYVVLLVAPLVVTPISVGLQGLDALDLPLSGLTQGVAWHTGQATAYGFTAFVATCAVSAAAASWFHSFSSPHVARVLSLLGLLGVGLALSLSGHAGTVEPRWLTRSAVFLHAVCVAFWIGALVPLIVALRADTGALLRFSRLIPYALGALVLTGVTLAIVQLDRVDALWTTRYGLVLSCKLAAVAVLLALAAANRYVFTPRIEAKGVAAARPLVTTIKIELAIALLILALVALWRFTPPPRALAAAATVSVHIHGEKAMAQVEIEPVRARGAKVSVLLLDGELRPLAAKELTLVFSNPAAGIEPVRRVAVHEGESAWRIDDLRIPVAGRWRLRAEILISDFDKIAIEDQVELPRTP